MRKVFRPIIDNADLKVLYFADIMPEPATKEMKEAHLHNVKSYIAAHYPATPASYYPEENADTLSTIVVIGTDTLLN